MSYNNLYESDQKINIDDGIQKVTSSYKNYVFIVIH